ncbi:MAG TPA: asparagine synthase (glutamine-hydrolyzing) [Bryobacteraceae bacterium]|nr:asparagine synthase (glutamine-hydrolyzing) [Bryobacteraceae bacterium]
MCGIAGFLTSHPDPLILTRMCDRIAHRGPDDFGIYRDHFAALGHRRLSIIDLRGGKQPLSNEDGSLMVTFNGEIYNYRELRSDLIQRGHRFRTESDTEVLVHLYEDVGERLPEFLRGMFAFAIWDLRRRELFLARDRFGEKPLYYSSSIPGMRFCFASELKALTVLDSFQPKLDPTSLADYLALGYVPDPKSIYQGVAKLLPAHSLLVSESGEKLRRYWEPDFTVPKQRDFSAAVEQLRSLAGDAVAGQLVSEVPLGAFLSGGVDSSAVVAHMAQRSSHQVKTFSIGFTNEEFDETRYARMVAERYSTDHRERIVTPDIEEILPTLVEHYDEPFADSSAVPMLYLARMTREHVTVALSGDGADEVFGGYRRYYWGVAEERIRARFPQWFRQSVFAFGGRHYPKFDYLPQVFRAKTLLSNLAREIGDAYFTSVSGFRDESLQEVLSPDLRKELNGYSPRRDFVARFEKVKHLAPLEQMQAVDFETYLPGDILVKVDRATMAYSLESRAPWLDHRIAEFACSLPPEWKLRGNVGKYIFKEAVRPDLPDTVLDRRKMGFSVPLAQWFRGPLKPAFEASVLRPDMKNCVNIPALKRLWREHQSGRSDHSRKLWTTLKFGMWDAQHRMNDKNTVFALAGKARSA